MTAVDTQVTLPTSSRSAAPRRVVVLLLSALFLSGFAAMVNEAVWQRALKIYLAGCESASSTIIVVVFMLGLGAGSLGMGLFARRAKNPLATIGLIEFCLFAVNLAIAGVLSRDIAESIYGFQRLATSLGIPLRVVYGLSAAAVLMVPCFLMGTTLPLASEAAQRQLRCADSKYIAILFVLNTLGSVLGGAAGGFLLMPCLGQSASLVVGASANGAAAAILLVLVLTHSCDAEGPTQRESLHFRAGRLTADEVLGFWLGFLALAYEMYLLRVVALAHRPLPFNFSLVLCYFLLYWSLGLFLAKRLELPVRSLLLAAAALVAAMPAFHLLDRAWLHRLLAGSGDRGLPALFSAAIYCLPCVPFGWVFGLVVARGAQSWGSDVGRFYALNTLGSCLGILATTLLGYEINHAYTAMLIGLGYAGLARYARANGQPADALAVGGNAVLVASLAMLFPLHLAQGCRPAWFASWPRIGHRVGYFGKEGVIEIANRNMIWDGLWHSKLSEHDDHVGTNNWLLAVIPLLCHARQPVDDALVIGLGTGITAGTLTRSDGVARVDAYEINHKLEQILGDYPEGTLGVGRNPKIRILWQDARSGLALSDKQYDLITQQPLYLKQAGSSVLLSREYFRLVRKRLKKHGVFCAYSNCMGAAAQARLVRATIASVFAHCESFGQGYMVVASDSPIVFDAAADVYQTGNDRLAKEIRRFGRAALHAYRDQPRLSWDTGPWLITDDHPLVEYPYAIDAFLPPEGPAPTLYAPTNDHGGSNRP